MSPVEAFKKYWNNPKRICLPVEQEDVTTAMVAESAFLAGYSFAQDMSAKTAKMVAVNAMKGLFTIPKEKAEIVFATAAETIYQLILNVHKGPEKEKKPPKKDMH
jgi:hypothetical protein